MNKYFDFVNKNFGFGCMRLPMMDCEVNKDEFQKMVDYFIENGFNYFDTAHVYIKGKSELALKECLTNKYKRNQFVLTNKLSGSCFNSNEDIRPFFNSQLESCGVDYFDFYLMHSQDKETFEKFKRCKAYEEAFKLKEEGKIKYVGFSFHDNEDVLDEILTEYPNIDVVQIQLNYLDYYNPNVRSKACYEVCVKHNKPVIIMEPIKGGRLINLPTDCMDILNKRNLSPSNIALRFATSHDNVMMVLSGMSNFEQMQENVSFMKEYVPLTKEEKDLALSFAQIIKKQNEIGCTGCKYCVDGCPKHILIPEIFKCYNNKVVYNEWGTSTRYNEIITKNGNPNDCLKCGKCESICPQHLNIRELLDKVSNMFTK